MKVLFVWPNNGDFGNKPIGLSLLSGIARDLGWESELFDTSEINFKKLERDQVLEGIKLVKPVDYKRYGLVKKDIDLKSSLEKTIEEYHPDCIAISVLSDEVMVAAQITRLIKDKYSGIPVIWGGVYPTINPEKTLLYYGADFACVGEGIDAFEEFLKALTGQEDLYNIRNIWAKKGNTCIENDPRHLRENLDRLPYLDWEIYDKRHFYRPFDGQMYITGEYMSNWGCPFSCTYCINNFLHNRYHKIYHTKNTLRRHSVERVIKELKYLKEKYSIEMLRFFDENFLLRPINALEQFSREYKKEINIPFLIQTSTKSVTPKNVELLLNMNCIHVSISIETGDSNLRKNVLKRFDKSDDIVKACKLLKEAGIRNTGLVMLGIPYETRDTYEKTIELCRKAEVQYPMPNFFYPYEGTELREISIQGGFLDPQSAIINDQYKPDLHKPSLHFSYMKKEELIQMGNVFVLYVKLPELYHEFIKRSEKTNRVGIQLRKKLAEIYEKTVFSNNGWFVDDGLQEAYINELKLITRR